MKLEAGYESGVTSKVPEVERKLSNLEVVCFTTVECWTTGYNRKLRCCGEVRQEYPDTAKARYKWSLTAVP